MQQDEDDYDYWNRSDLRGFNFEVLDVPETTTISPKTKEETEKILFAGMVETTDDGSFYTEDFSLAPREKSYDIGAISARFRQSSITDENQRSKNVLKDHITQDYSASYVANLQSDIQVLKRQLQSTLHPKEVMNEMIHDRHCNLGGYRGRQDKVALLDAAIDSHDGNAIIRTVLHLKHNTKPSIFQQELQSRPVAVDHYLAYLRFNNKFEEMANILEMLGRNREAAMVLYQKAISSSTTEGTLRLLQKYNRTHFESEPSFQSETVMISGYIDLLQKQLPIEADDAKLEKEGKSELFKKIPRIKSLLKMSVLDTLYYCCLYHFDLDEKKFASPLAIRKDHRLTNKQFNYTVVSAMAEMQQWNRIDDFTFSKNYAKVLKPRSEINMAKISEMLANKKAPTEILSKYVSHVEDSELRLELAKRFACHDVVIETLVRMKDKVQLFQYKSKLPPQSREYLLAEGKLKQHNVKWKN